MKAIIDFLGTITGINGGPWLNWWGGFGSSLSEFGIFLVVYKKLQCHAPTCYRIGLHRTADGKYLLCRKHHPDVKNNLTLADIHAEHFAALEKLEGKVNDKK
ncbi:MAG: hypothetical protein LBI13_11425 [Streptococcaceae bacterium]|jgi:hypothetical protein|nr:hypothetical protein [Streptococcaceae bacterium]